MIRPPGFKSCIGVQHLGANSRLRTKIGKLLGGVQIAPRTLILRRPTPVHNLFNDFLLMHMSLRRLTLLAPVAGFALGLIFTSALRAQEITEQQLNVRVLELSKQKDAVRARKMVEEGAAVNSRNCAGETPLMLWIKAGDPDMVSWLIGKGADVNLAAINKSTPLMAAAFAGRTDIMRALLDAGADVGREDQVFKTAMVYAAAQGHGEAVVLLLERGVDVNRQYAHNLTALMWAAGYGKTDCVRELLDRGADPKLKDDRGKTARDIAQDQGFEETAVLLPASGA